ncbi:MAG: hypothetical protein AVO35_12095 [Candidatus Aegiribacteria sp. MLS_C]|nr:MAG: hypothetical protein AVO35_12095 [Candidatus Aegiribacteria sp. MLS_C]
MGVKVTAGGYRMLPAAAGTAAAVAMMAAGCISDQGTFNQVEITGYVMNEADSTPVPGAYLIFDLDVHYSKGNTPYTDSSGYYEYRTGTFPSQDWNPIDIKVTVTDVDGDSNGVFISEDTTLHEDNTEHLSDISFELDFYVEFVDGTAPDCRGSLHEI